MPENVGVLPELLLPAGSPEQLHAGLLYGGDAFYLGGDVLSLRAQSKGFGWDQLQDALNLVHQQGKRIYFCLNIVAQEKHLAQVREHLQHLKAYAIDGLIISDPGVIQLAQDILPEVPIHLSTQANTSNSAAVQFWQQQGVQRINLARELDWRSIKAIRNACPDVELEMFVHGAMCMAISGRCLLSAYLNERSANLGLCTNPCRFQYKPMRLIVCEEKRAEQALWEVVQGADYSKILAADDLCLVKYLAWCVHMGLHALKVEGRTKSASYVAQVADVYKTALQDVMVHQKRYTEYMDALRQVGDRDLSTGLFLGAPRKITQHQRPDKPVVAQVIAQHSPDKWEVQIKSPWKAEQAVQVLVPGLQRPTILPGDYRLEDQYGQTIITAHPGTSALLRTEHDDIQPGYFLRCAVR